MPETLLTITLYSADAAPVQLCGPAMVKATGDVTLARTAACFCRWAGLPPDVVAFYFNGQPLETTLTLQQSGLISGNALHARLVVPGVSPSQEAARAPFAMLDVLESELLGLDGMAMR
jgi:hypothetical protein